MTNSTMTIGEYIESLKDEFRKLPIAERRKLVREAKQMLCREPHMADTNGFWRGLSTRHVTQA